MTPKAKGYNLKIKKKTALNYGQYSLEATETFAC